MQTPAQICCPIANKQTKKPPNSAPLICVCIYIQFRTHYWNVISYNCTPALHTFIIVVIIIIKKYYYLLNPLWFIKYCHYYVSWPALFIIHHSCTALFNALWPASNCCFSFHWKINYNWVYQFICKVQYLDINMVSVLFVMCVL